MRPNDEEFEDEQAEEENKIINEVCSTFFVLRLLYINAYFLHRSTRSGIVYFKTQMMRNEFMRDYRKKNSPYLYDVVMTSALPWPSLTCQWFPDKES